MLHVADIAQDHVRELVQRDQGAGQTQVAVGRQPVLDEGGGAGPVHAWWPCMCQLSLESRRARRSRQSTPWRIVQADDGTLYLVSGTGRMTVEPATISDAELAALTDLGGQGGLSMARVAGCGREPGAARTFRSAYCGEYGVTWHGWPFPRRSDCRQAAGQRAGAAGFRVTTRDCDELAPGAQVALRSWQSFVRAARR